MILDKKVKPKFETAVYRGDDTGYAVASNMNAFFKVDFKNNTSEFIHFFEDENPRGEDLYTSILPFGKELLLIPGAAKNLIIFSPEKETYKKINVYTGKMSPWHDYAKYSDAIIFENKIILVPERYSYVTIVDPNTSKVEFIDIGVEDSTWKRRGTWLEGGIFKTVAENSPRMLTFNMRTKKPLVQDSYSEKKILPKLKEIEKNKVDYSEVDFELSGDLDSYWRSVFETFEKHGAVQVKEEDKWLSFEDMTQYVEWKKAK